jgi:hypothetical protein
MGFRRHEPTKKVKKKRTTQNRLGCPWLTAFSVDQKYSLTGCSPAEPVSACPGETNLHPTLNNNMNSFQLILGFR